VVPPRFLLACLAGLVLAWLAFVGRAAGATPTLAFPALAPQPAFASSLAPVRDRILARAPRSLADDQWWGGPITDSNGETFKFYISSHYPQDQAVRARRANFLGWALHGNELLKLTVYQAPLSEVQQLCGGIPDVLACYYPGQSKIVFPGDTSDPQLGPLNLSEILLHEYGHHIAAHRRNDPWPAIDWGAKNWASFENICTRAATYQVHPGDEGSYYLLNPGEAFAETYRLLNVERAEKSNPGWYKSWGDPLPWRWQTFSHTSATLAALQKDVEHPWDGGRTLRWSGRTPRFKHGTNGVSFYPMASRRVYPTLDGTITLDLTKAPRGSFITLQRPNGTSVSARRSITTQVCGESWLTLGVTTVAGRRPFRVTVSMP
jgi:hypothetical protein